MPRLSARDIQRLGPKAREQIRRALRDAEDSQAVRARDVKRERVPSKYHNVPTTIDGITFASQREAKRYGELKLELLASAITGLELQKPFSLDLNGIHICTYIADFVYRRNGEQITEDAKGKRLEVYKIKRKLMLAVHGIEVVEV